MPRHQTPEVRVGGTRCSTTCGCDANGNLTSDSVHTYAWDSDGNSITVGGVGLTFDALDRMVEQNRSGRYTQIVYGPNGSKLALMNGQALTKAFLPLPGGATAVYNSSGLAHYRHSDWLGSSRLASTLSRMVYHDAAYGPYGENSAEAGTPDRNFTGQNQDTISSGPYPLYDFLYREYHPTWGRWMSPDPLSGGGVDDGGGGGGGGCDPSDPTCGAGGSGCDPNDPTCGAGGSGCDPSDPTCGGGDGGGGGAGGGCDPSDPTCGGGGGGGGGTINFPYCNPKRSDCLLLCYLSCDVGVAACVAICDGNFICLLGCVEFAKVCEDKCQSCCGK